MILKTLLVSLAIEAVTTGLILGVAWAITGGWMWGVAIRGGVVASIAGGALYAWLGER